MAQSNRPCSHDRDAYFVNHPLFPPAFLAILSCRFPLLFFSFPQRSHCLTPHPQTCTCTRPLWVGMNSRRELSTLPLGKKKKKNNFSINIRGVISSRGSELGSRSGAGWGYPSTPSPCKIVSPPWDSSGAGRLSEENRPYG